MRTYQREDHHMKGLLKLAFLVMAFPFIMAFFGCMMLITISGVCAAVLANF